MPDLDYIAKDLRPLARPIASLTLDPNNARKHPRRQIADIRASLAEHGQLKAIVVHAESGVIKAGNGTVRAAMQLGWTHIAATVWSATEEEARRFALRDNRVAELATWDQDELLSQLRGMDDSALGLGWSDRELERMLRPPDPPPTDGEVGEVEPLTAEGDRVELGRHVLHCLDCVEVMRELPDDSVDAVVTDPPYLIGFMGKGWDNAAGEDIATSHATWACEAFRVLKPGAHLVAFAATRTVHRLTCALEDAGFEVRDLLGWLQWQGFPKSLDVGKAIDKAAGAERDAVGQHPAPARMDRAQSMGAGGWQDAPGLTEPATADAKRWDGWGTGLKPALEPAILVRKPLAGTVADNVLEHGTGALHIDACRYRDDDPAWPAPRGVDKFGHGGARGAGFYGETGTPQIGDRLPCGVGSPLGRWPANVYYCPKPAVGEREAGTEPRGQGGSYEFRRDGSLDGKVTGARGNTHPTVKPVRLIRWLLRLVTPPGGTVLEPFLGSGTALVAAVGLDLQIVAAETDPTYCDIARARWAHAEEDDGGAQ